MLTRVLKEELQAYVGKELGVSDWFEIKQDRIDQFADVTVDHQFIHIDAEKVKTLPIGSTIAHGFLSLSMLTYLCLDLLAMPEGITMGLNYGFDKVRFLAPVKVNGKIRARVTLKNIEEKGQGGLLFQLGVIVEIKGEKKPALIAEWLLIGM